MDKKLTFADIKKGTYFKIAPKYYLSNFIYWYHDPNTILRKCDNKSIIAKNGRAFGVENSKIVRTKLSQFLNTKVMIHLDEEVIVAKLVTIVI